MLPLAGAGRAIDEAAERSENGSHNAWPCGADTMDHPVREAVGATGIEPVTARV
jgi:hypothetical protein